MNKFSVVIVPTPPHPPYVGLWPPTSCDDSTVMCPLMLIIRNLLWRPQSTQDSWVAVMCPTLLTAWCCQGGLGSCVVCPLVVGYGSSSSWLSNKRQDSSVKWGQTSPPSVYREKDCWTRELHYPNFQVPKRHIIIFLMFYNYMNNQNSPNSLIGNHIH